MAISKNGILGTFTGKAGAVVGYELRGRNIIRGLPREKTGEPTEKEIANRKKFADLQSWLQPITEFLRIGFANYAPTYEGFVAAKSYNSHHAIKGSFPDFIIDPALALVSFGKLAQAQKASAVADTPKTITFSWDECKHKYNDRCMLLAYDIENGMVAFETAGPQSQKKRAVLELTDHYAGKKVHVYLAFVSENRKKQSMSQYLGELLVPVS